MMIRKLTAAVAAASILAFAQFACAADALPLTVKSGDWVVPEFQFSNGAKLKDVRLHYRTIGDPKNPAVLVLHGTAGDGARFLTKRFAGKMFLEGQPLDASKYFLILPDALGSGQSTKPSDGLKGKFPVYDYDDMVRAQYRLVTEGLGIKHLKLVIGHSMGGMHTWMWAEKYPGFMDAAVPMAALPSAMSSRNWLMRRMITDAIRNDPDWKNGEYTEQPQKFRYINTFFVIATNGGSIAWQKRAPTREAADKELEKRLAKQTKLDANDFLYQWQSSWNYDPAPMLGNIKAPVLAILAADDERNPHETGLMQKAVSSLPNGQLCLIPASEKTSGHGTTMTADHWKEAFAAFFRKVK